jgi:hypothetical protein
MYLDYETGKWMKIKQHPLEENPTWFKPQELQEPEFYEIVIAKEAYYGKMWVDRKHNRVLVKTSYS